MDNLSLLNLDTLATAANANAREKGFWDPDTPENRIVFYLKQAMMTVTEVAEVVESIRKSKGERDTVEEMADVLIRLLDLYGGMVEDGFVESSLQEVLLEKMNYNSTERPRMHGVLA